MRISDIDCRAISARYGVQAFFVQEWRKPAFLTALAAWKLFKERADEFFSAERESFWNTANR